MRVHNAHALPTIIMAYDLVLQRIHKSTYDIHVALSVKPALIV